MRLASCGHSVASARELESCFKCMKEFALNFFGDPRHINPDKRNKTLFNVLTCNNPTCPKPHRQFATARKAIKDRPSFCSTACLSATLATGRHFPCPGCKTPTIASKSIGLFCSLRCKVEYKAITRLDRTFRCWNCDVTFKFKRGCRNLFCSHGCFGSFQTQRGGNLIKTLEPREIKVGVAPE